MIKKFEFRLNDITSEPFIYDTEKEEWQQDMEQDQIDWVISMSDYGKKELEHEVRCNNCMWTGYEEDLRMLNEPGIGKTLDFFKGCPNCKTDSYLIDL